MSQRTETNRTRTLASSITLALALGWAFAAALPGSAHADTAANPDTNTRLVVNPAVPASQCNPTGSPIPAATAPCATASNGATPGDSSTLTGVHGGGFVSIHIDGSSGSMFGVTQTRLCRGSLTGANDVNLSSQLSPTNGDCIPGNAAGVRGGETGNGNHSASGSNPPSTYLDYTFKIGEGQYNPPGAPAIRCGPGSPCTLWIQESVSNAVDASGSVFKHYIVQYAPTTSADFDTDAHTDLSVYRTTANAFFAKDSSTGNFDQAYVGQAGDVPVPADYDGLGTSEFAVYRPSTGAWFVRNPFTGVVTQTYFGNGTDDIPVPADYTGDGKADLAVYRPSAGLWMVKDSSTGAVTLQYFGMAGSADTPVPADYDGDGKADFAIYRQSAGEWFVRRSSDSVVVQTPWGNGTTDVPVVADYDGDGKADIAVYRPDTGAWFIINSSGGTAQQYFGNGSTDIPQPGDYDGDGHADLAVYRPSLGLWFLNQTTNGFVQTHWGSGSSTDVAAPLPYAVSHQYFSAP